MLAELTAEQEKWLIDCGYMRTVTDRVARYEPIKAPIPEVGSNIAQKAAELVCGDRNDSYGHPGQDYAGTAKVWSGLLIDKLKPGVEISAREAILMMVGLKCRREVTKPKEDNRIDAIGYILCEDWVVTGNKPTPLANNK